MLLPFGCRPFSALYIVAFFIYFCIKDRKIGFKNFIKKDILPLIPVVFIAIILMSYNWIRFGNVLEFGHNYLPEFTNSPNGQFNIAYTYGNLVQLLTSPITIDDRFNINFPMPFMFYIANPLYLLAMYRSIKDIIKSHKISVTRLIILVSIIINIFLLCCHKTLGGWQFGARYTCDMLPFVLLCIVITKQTISTNNATQLLNEESVYVASLDRFEIACILFGIILNIFGIFVLWQNL